MTISVYRPKNRRPNTKYDCREGAALERKERRGLGTSRQEFFENYAFTLTIYAMNASLAPQWCQERDEEVVILSSYIATIKQLQFADRIEHLVDLPTRLLAFFYSYSKITNITTAH